MTHIILSGNLIINDKKEIYLLYRIKQQFYETPGGKVKVSECTDINNPTMTELQQTAQRELLEEVGGIQEIISIRYFDKIQFTVPDGRSAIAYKFITTVKGKLFPNEEIFDKEKSGYIAIDKLSEFSLSPDLKKLLPKIQKLIL